MKLTELSPEWRWVYGAVVLAGAVLFLLSVQSALSPFIAFLFFLLLLVPYAGSPRHTTVVIATTLVFLVWLLDTLGSLLAPFILAFVLAYILDPAADALERRGLKRGPAVAILVLPVLALLGLGLAFGIPALINQLENLLQGLPAAAASLSTWVEGVRDGALRMSIPFISDEVLVRWLDPARVEELVAAQQEALAQRAWGAVSGVGRGLGIALSLLGFVVLVPVLVIYLLRDFDHMIVRAGELVPKDRREGWLGFMREYDGLLSRFLRGQVIAASIVGVMTWLGLWIAGVPYSGLVGAIAGVFNLVPYLGLVVSIGPVLIIALISGSFLTIVVKAGIVFAIVQGIDGSITGPRIVGSSVGLHPVWVLLALAVGSSLFGFVGLLVAMPAAVLIKLLLREAVVRYRASSVYLGTDGVD
ncbi:MAG TPA: AI-2E family transporter [Longimicrobiales bacterium]|nr:AI-2E family transporter [Longimicrobiales bacterium]